MGRKLYEVTDRTPELEELQFYIGKSKSYTFYRKHGDNIIIINASRIVRFGGKTLYDNLITLEENLVTPTDSFFFVHGDALGKLIAKNYWKFAVEDMQRPLNSVNRERVTHYYIDSDKTKGKMAILNGRIDILDNSGNGKIIEVKTTTKTKIDLPIALRQCVLYKMSLLQENKQEYKDYQCQILAYHINWKKPEGKPTWEELKDSYPFRIYEPKDEEKIMIDLRNRFKIVQMFLDDEKFDESKLEG